MNPGFSDLKGYMYIVYTYTDTALSLAMHTSTG